MPRRRTAPRPPPALTRSLPPTPLSFLCANGQHKRCPGHCLETPGNGDHDYRCECRCHSLAP